MPTRSITEWLGERKTITKKVEKKHEAIYRNAVRDGKLRDPFEAEGGTAAYVRSQLQSIKDMEGFLVRILAGIQHKNLDTPLTLRGRTWNVAEWLIWRREVAPKVQARQKGLMQALEKCKLQSQQQGRKVVGAGESNVDMKEVQLCVDEAQLTREIEEHEAVLGELDGKLSLLNATTLVEVVD